MRRSGCRVSGQQPLGLVLAGAAGRRWVVEGAQQPAARPGTGSHGRRQAPAESVDRAAQHRAARPKATDVGSSGDRAPPRRRTSGRVLQHQLAGELAAGDGIAGGEGEACGRGAAARRGRPSCPAGSPPPPWCPPAAAPPGAPRASRGALPAGAADGAARIHVEPAEGVAAVHLLGEGEAQLVDGAVPRSTRSRSRATASQGGDLVDRTARRRHRIGAGAPAGPGSGARPALRIVPRRCASGRVQGRAPYLMKVARIARWACSRFSASSKTTRVRPVHHLVGDLLAAVGRQAVQHDVVRVRAGQQLRR